MIADDLRPLAVAVDRLTFLEGNPRRGDVKAVARSYRRFGQRKPLVARQTGERDGLPVGEVVAGNHQLAAARELGWGEVAVVWVGDDDDTARAFALADNRTADLGVYDEAALGVMLESVRLSGDEELFAATGFTDDDLADMLAAGRPPEDVGDGDDVEDAEAIVDPITKPGDVWLLGRHRLVCGDSTDASVVALAVDGSLADMVWTDPPYGVAIASRIGTTGVASTAARAQGKQGIQNDEMDVDQLTEFLRSAFKVTLDCTKPGGAWYVAAPHGPIGVAFSVTLHELGVWRHSLVWVKDTLVLGRSDYHYRHEPIYYGWKPGGAHYFADSRSETTVLEFPRPRRSEEHPTMKPVALVAYCIGNSTASGDLVLDPFGGSGPTLIAAHDLGRTAALVELDPRYCDVICRRWQTFTDEMPVLESSGEPRDFGYYGPVESAA